MPKPTTFTVHAAPGVVVPFHASTKAGPGGTQFMLASGETVEVPNDSHVRRSMKRGDLHEGAPDKCKTCNPPAPKGK